MQLTNASRIFVVTTQLSTLTKCIYRPDISALGRRRVLREPPTVKVRPLVLT